VASPLSRRSFLVGAATAVGAVACGSKAVIVVPKPGPTSQLNLLETSDQYVSGVDQRVAFVLRGAQDFIRPGGPVTVALGTGPDPDHLDLGQPVTTVIHTDADPAPAYVTMTSRFPGPGTYWAKASYQGKSATAPLTVVAPSASRIPAAGQPMISTPTPTFENHRGVQLLCTREPQCPWHDVSLDVALTQHRPIALLFATPRLCQTATCGPVLDQLLSLKTAFEGKVRFLHSEIYTDLTAKTLDPAVQAFHLETEPKLFLAGADGIVTTRIDGLFGHGEAMAALTRLTAA
jgi:hypothetical protein